MTFDDLKQALWLKPHDLSQRMFHYGYSCGERGCVCFQDIRTAFYNYNVPEEQVLTYMRGIISGYVAGLNGG